MKHAVFLCLFLSSCSLSGGNTNQSSNTFSCEICNNGDGFDCPDQDSCDACNDVTNGSCDACNASFTACD